MHVLRKLFLILALAWAGLILPSSAVMAGKVYWVQSFEDRIGRANLDGSGPQVLPTFVFDPIAITVDPAGGKFYFIQSFDDSILRADLNGTNVETVLAPPQVFDPVAIAVDSVNGKIYCAQSFDDRIFRANFDGSALETIVALPTSLDPVAIAVDSIAGKIYWAENPGNRIRRADLNGNNAETVVDPIFVADAVSIAVDGGNGKLYWAERSGDRIRRADTGGFNLNVVTFLDAVFVSDPVSISLDLVNARIFWAEAADSRIRRADLTGANVLTILQPPALFDPLSISVDPTPSSGLPPTPLPDTFPNDTTRYLSMSVPPSSTAAPPALTALRVRLVDLQNPIPPNLPMYPPPNFSTFESGAGCTDPSGCVRWVGRANTFRESQNNVSLGSFRAARLQCTPFYSDWSAEGGFHVTGAEVVPSSKYDVQNFASSCAGNEPACTAVSSALRITTPRHSDIVAPFNPPATSTQPDGLDVVALVSHFKNSSGSVKKVQAQLQPNLPELLADVSALDIVACVDAFKGFAYSFSGPCVCPSTVVCGAAACAGPNNCLNGGLCVRTCLGGANADEPCINNTHCPSGVCGGGFCRDRCGRCNP